MMKLAKTVPVWSLLLLSGTTLAHPGHDHQHWSATLMHTALGISLSLAAAIGVAAIIHTLKQRKQDQSV